MSSKKEGFYPMTQNKRLNSARMKDVLYNLPKAIEKIRNPPLASIENVGESYEEVFDGLDGQGVENIIPSDKIDIYTRLKILLGLKLFGHTNTVTEASSPIDELYKRGEIQNKLQYRNAPNNSNTQ